MNKFIDRRDIIRFEINRFQQILLHCRVLSNMGLRNMFELEQWITTKYDQLTNESASKAKKIIFGLDKGGRNFCQEIE